MNEPTAQRRRPLKPSWGSSQLERGNLAIDAQSGPLGEILCELAERARPTLDRPGAVLELDVPRDLHARFDRDALARIIGNLLDNAEKYARHAEDRAIRLSAVDRGEVVEVSVADRGPGIADSSKLSRFGAAAAAAMRLQASVLDSHCRGRSLARWVVIWSTDHAKAAVRRSFCNSAANSTFAFHTLCSV